MEGLGSGDPRPLVGMVGGAVRCSYLRGSEAGPECLAVGGGFDLQRGGGGPRGSGVLSSPDSSDRMLWFWKRELRLLVSQAPACISMIRSSLRLSIGSVNPNETMYEETNFTRGSLK